MQKPTVQRLRELFHYEPATGEITNKIGRGKVAAGARAGTVNDAGYVVVCVDHCDVRGHHIAWAFIKGVLPTHEIDHENGNRADNRWSNLRPATRGEQMHNLRRSARNRSGYKGVSWHTAGGRWQAHIRCDGKNYYLGLFDTPEEAHGAYKIVATKLHGVFARFD